MKQNPSKLARLSGFARVGMKVVVASTVNTQLAFFHCAAIQGLLVGGPRPAQTVFR